MAEVASPATSWLPASRIVEDACRQLVAAHASDMPAFARATILIPTLQSQQQVARGLRQAAGASVLLLPRITTLRLWAEEVVLERNPTPRVARETLLYEALASRGWFDRADLWAVAAELGALFDDLTRWHVGMPESLPDFRARLERAYHARKGASFAFEARLVFELWHALAQDGERLDAEAAYQLRLGRLAEDDDAPVYALGLGTLAPSERQFLERRARRAKVHVFEIRREAGPDMSSVERILATAWPEPSEPALRDRAASLRCAMEASALSGRLSFFGAHGVEQEARAIDRVVRQWLHLGRSGIAVVALDRVVARRARALLERAEVLVRDEAGWAISTTSAATVISRWFDVCSEDFYYRDLLDFLKSPFVFADWARGRRQEAVWRLEQRLRRAGVRAGIERYIASAEECSDFDARDMLHAVQRAFRAFATRKRKSLVDWLHALEAVMQEVGLATSLDSDAAGTQVRDLLRRLMTDLAADRTLFGFGEFRRWIGRQFEAAAFRDAGIESPVVFTSLASTRLRRFDAVLIAGADEAHLVGLQEPGLFFNQAVRRELGLPGDAQAVREMETSLFGLLACAGEACITWQQTRGGEPNLLAPALERLRTLHELAWGDRLNASSLASALSGQAKRLPGQGGTRVPLPVVPPDALPSAISASGYNALMACPYRFFAHQVLRLREADEVEEEIEKRDYGNLLHAILHRFHGECPRVAVLGASHARDRLLAVTQSVFADALATDYLARAWKMRWEKLVPEYVDWQIERETEGWLFRAGEVQRSLTIVTPAGRRFELRGRIDRVDERADGSVAVVDYKTQAVPGLRERLRLPGEDVQLCIYELLWGAPVDEAMFLSLDREGPSAVRQEGDLAALSDEVRERLAHLLDRIGDGAPLPAQGSERTCAYCEASGLCRRRHWS